MISIATFFAIAALAFAANDTNVTNVTNDVISKLANRFASDDLALINATVKNLQVNKELVAKLSGLVNKNLTKPESIRVPTYNAYDDGNGPKIGVVDESPDYASSVVLASDLLSLSSAVAAVTEKTCREQGYQFLDGLLMNRRWALKTSSRSLLQDLECGTLADASRLADPEEGFGMKPKQLSIGLSALLFDASAKSPQGLLFGSSYHLGNFDECVGIQDPGDNGVSIKGQYCLATINWKQRPKKKKVRTGRGETLRWAVCVPSSCNADAVESFVNSVLSYTVGNSTGVEVTDRDCYKRTELRVTSLDVGFLSLILLFAIILIFSTMFEIYIIYWSKEKESTLRDVIKSFSVINNIKKIISTKQHTSFGLECITGIKALAMMFILAGHACIFIASGPVMDAEAWDRLVKQPANGFMLNNALLVDTFLMLSAFLFSRLLLIELDKRRGKLNVLPILIFRYIRVTPAYFVVILFYMTWFPKLGEGPLWDDRLQLEKERCMESWWTNILYINNYVNTDKLCMFQSWYLSVDTQLFFVAPIFIFSLWRWKRLGLIFMSLAIVVSMVIPAVITYMDNLDPTFLFYAKEVTDISSNFYFTTAYIKTHMKMTMYFMGILTGYVLHRIQSQNYQFSNLLKAFGWVTSVILGTVVTFSVTLFYQDWYQYNNIEAAAYISLHKLAWSMCNGWLIIACATGNGGIFGKLLTWKFLAPISRLTFCAYLVNGIVELYYVGQLRHPVHITFFTVLASSISHIVLTFALAVMLCVTFESPLHGIEKILLRKFARPPISDNVIKNESGESSRNTSQSKLDS